MTRRRLHPMAASTLRSFVIDVRGSRFITEAGVAKQLGLTSSELRRKIAAKRGCFDAKWIFEVPASEAGGTVGRRCRLAFDEHGVMMIAALQGDERSLELGLKIANVLKPLWVPAKQTVRASIQEMRLQRRLYELIIRNKRRG